MAAIYAFARVADDIADEPGLSSEERLEAIGVWLRALHDARDGRPSGAVFTALSHTIELNQLPFELFVDLLDAFRYDCRHPGFEDIGSLLEYSKKSAQPVGRLILHLFREATDSNIEMSDAICTGLQLTNFWQDISTDVPRSRLTIPREVLRTFSVSIEELKEQTTSERADAMIAFLVNDARHYLRAGARLPGLISSFRLKRQIRSTIAGGLSICDKIEGLKSRVFVERPTIGRMEAVRLLLIPG